MTTTPVLRLSILLLLFGCAEPLETPAGDHLNKEAHGDEYDIKLINGKLESVHPAVVALVGPGGKLCTGSIVPPH